MAIREANPFPSVCARVCDHRCEKSCRLAVSGEAPVAIRTLKRFITDNTDPGVYKPLRAEVMKAEKVAIVGAGPAGLTAAHMLSLRGYKVTVFDAVFLALGAMKSLPLRVEGEQPRGVYPSLRFLSDFNLRGVSLAKGKVGVVGGGNSAIDAARIALRQEGVDEVTIIYRRTREEMPAYSEDIDAAIDEGAIPKCLLMPVGVQTDAGAIVGLTCVKNEFGPCDSSGRRPPVMRRPSA